MQLKNGSFCPLIKKECVQLQCAWFTQLRGTHPQTGAEIDEWMCAISAMPMLVKKKLSLITASFSVLLPAGAMCPRSCVRPTVA